MIFTTFNLFGSVVGYDDLRWLKQKMPVTPLANEAIRKFLRGRFAVLDNDEEHSDILSKDFAEMSITEEREVFLSAKGPESANVVLTGADAAWLINLLRKEAFLL